MSNSLIWQVTWYYLSGFREYEVRYDTPGYLDSREGDMYRLTISQVSGRELTNFTCKAQNEVGYSKGHIEITG